jgi:penicillin-binding protein 1C
MIIRLTGRACIIAASALSLAAVGLLAASIWFHRPVVVPQFAALRAAYAPSDAFLLDRHGVILDTERIDFGVERLPWVPLSDVSPALVAAVVDGEDRRFWQHHGIDWRGAIGAFKDDLLRNRRRGASTITMQLATLLQHSHRPTGTFEGWTRKLSQARYALSLERSWSKVQILEVYLNLLDYRGELQGIGATAERLAGKTPSSLTLPESLVMAALLPQPSASPEQISRRACGRAQARRIPISCDKLRQTAQTLLAFGNREESERLAPHLAHALLKAPGQRLMTTLDAAAQRLTRDTLRSHLAELSSQNVRDGAALVVDNATGEVLAYVGSAGPGSRARNVDGVQAPRQAGSTLKPFLYEMAIERRYLTAASLLEDSPLNLDTATGTYIPQDYDHDFKGLVSVRTALASSLNVPAVRTLVLVGVEPFRSRLHELGYAGIIEDGDYYGYSLALGSAEVSLWQQAQAYRALARGGAWSPLTLMPTQEAAADKRELPAGASYIVADILSDRAARAVTFGLDSHLGTPFWSAAKTGTSKDMRDNWCIGFSRQFTVAVWVGNFEGDSMHDVSGVTGAAPIWHDIIVELQRDTPSIESTPPAGITATIIRFSPAVEPARQEWFLGRGPTTPIVAISASGEVTRIDSPANGMIIALDPDIPADRQRVPIAIHGDPTGKTLRLNDEVIGTATPLQLWSPKPGSYYLTLQDDQGRSLDRVFFTVRGESM